MACSDLIIYHVMTLQEYSHWCTYVVQGKDIYIYIYVLFIIIIIY